MLSCSIWFSLPSFWMGGGLDSRCVSRVYGADGAMHGTIRTVHTTYAAVVTDLRSNCHRPTQRLSRPPPIQKLGTENHMLQLNI